MIILSGRHGPAEARKRGRRTAGRGVETQRSPTKHVLQDQQNVAAATSSPRGMRADTRRKGDGQAILMQFKLLP